MMMNEEAMTNEEAIKTLKANYPDACFEQLREAVDTAINALKAQEKAREVSNNSPELDNNNGDLISREAAIDIGRNATVDTNPSHFEAHQKFMQFMDDAEISSFGRWQWSNGFNTALTAVGIDLEKLPSAQPEKRTQKRTETHACDCIERQAAIDDLKCKDPSQIWDTADVEVWVNALPSAQPELPEWAQKVEEYRQNAPQHIHNPLAWALYQVWKEYDR